MAMGDLARLPRPDEDGGSYDVPLDPWQRAVVAAQALEQQAPPQQSGPPPNMGSLYGMAGAGEKAKSIGEGMARSADYYAGMPQRQMQGVTPETPGQWSEDDEARQQQLLAERYQWGPQTALGMVFDPLGVKRSVGAGGVTLGSGAGSKIIQPETPAGIRAYHSSPHDFEKFDASMIGTGEGAQSYGHGLYFAENPAVSGQGGEYWMNFADRFKGPERLATNFLHAADFNRKEAYSMLRQAADNGGVPGYLANDALALLRSEKPVGPRTYEVNIKAQPEEMLNWDAPLAQQPQGVQERLKDVMGRGWKEFKHAAPDTAINSGLIDFDRRTASLRMQEAGIPGIRYLDQGSRIHAGSIDAMEQLIALQRQRSSVEALRGQLAQMKEKPLTSNYVMFPGTEDKVHIMAKYGLAGAVPTMGSLADMSYREQ